MIHNNLIRYIPKSLTRYQARKFYSQNSSFLQYNHRVFAYNRLIHTTRPIMAKCDVDKLKVITLEMLEANDGNNGNRLWICIKDLVYDVTDFHEHPGGMEEFVNVAGKDATENFEQVGHSATALDLMPEYLIGRLSKGE